MATDMATDVAAATQASTQEATQILAKFAATLGYDDLPARAREHCKNLLLDALACAVAGHQGEETGQVAALAAALAQGSESSVIGGGHLSLAGATLLNGYLVTAVTMCDVHRATMTHVTPEIVPPALAIAERDGLSGRDLLVAIAAGLRSDDANRRWPRLSGIPRARLAWPGHSRPVRRRRGGRLAPELPTPTPWRGRSALPAARRRGRSPHGARRR